MTLAWHFSKNKLDYDLAHISVQAGLRLSVDPDRLKPCNYGLHASVRPMDALGYAPCHVMLVSRVKLGGRIISDSDKLCAETREHLWVADCTETLRSFARWCALEVAHLWDCPDVVRRYLETGDESLRAAVCDAACDAARATTRDATWDAVCDAARAAVRAAACTATWAATRAAACDAACDARDVACDAAYEVARTAARDKQNTKLEEMLLALAQREVT